MAERFGVIEPYNSLYFKDSVFLRGQIKFAAIFKNAINYKWYLGTEVIEGPSDSVVFRNITYPIDLPYGSYTAALVIDYEIDSECFPNALGRDSIFKTFKKIPLKQIALASKYKGVFLANPTDTIVLELAVIKNFTGPTGGDQLCAINLLGNSDTIYAGSSLVAYVNKRIAWRAGFKQGWLNAGMEF
jgi:hypothetical protein